MPAASRRALAGATLLATLLGTAGCGGMDSAGAAGVTRDDLASQLADRLVDGSAHTYTATYRLSGGATAQVVQAQRPARSAVHHPGGLLVRTATTTTRCDSERPGARCTVTPAAPTDRDLLASNGLITAESALGLLEAAAVDPQVEVEHRVTTIAGQPAACLRLEDVDDALASAFTVCVTGDGALGSFTGAVRGRAVDVVLTDYATGADPDDLTVPAGAHLSSRS